MLRITSRQALDHSSCVVVRWQTPRFRVYAIRCRGLLFESTPLEACGLLTPFALGHQITCVLRGEMLSRRDGRERSATPGFALVEPSLIWKERWMGPAFEALVIDWDPLLLPVHRTDLVPLGPGGTARVGALFERVLCGDDSEHTGQVVLDAGRDLLASLGVGRLAPDPSVDQPSSQEARATARWVSALRNDVRSAGFKQAMALTGLGERQLRRQYEQMAREAGMPSNLRTVLVTGRLVAATRLLSTSAPIGGVAQAAGFGSSRALGLALEHASMPTATEIRRLTRLG